MSRLPSAPGKVCRTGGVKEASQQIGQSRIRLRAKNLWWLGASRRTGDRERRYLRWLTGLLWLASSLVICLRTEKESRKEKSEWSLLHEVGIVQDWERGKKKKATGSAWTLLSEQREPPHLACHS